MKTEFVHVTHVRVHFFLNHLVIKKTIRDEMMHFINEKKLKLNKIELLSFLFFKSVVYTLASKS